MRLVAALSSMVLMGCACSSRRAERSFCKPATIVTALLRSRSIADT